MKIFAITAEGEEQRVARTAASAAAAAAAAEEDNAGGGGAAEEAHSREPLFCNWQLIAANAVKRDEDIDVIVVRRCSAPATGRLQYKEGAKGDFWGEDDRFIDPYGKTNLGFQEHLDLFLRGSLFFREDYTVVTKTEWQHTLRYLTVWAKSALGPVWGVAACTILPTQEARTLAAIEEEEEERESLFLLSSSPPGRHGVRPTATYADYVYTRDVSVILTRLPYTRPLAWSPGSLSMVAVIANTRIRCPFFSDRANRADMLYERPAEVSPFEWLRGYDDPVVTSERGFFVSDPLCHFRDDIVIWFLVGNFYLKAHTRRLSPIETYNAYNWQKIPTEPPGDRGEQGALVGQIDTTAIAGTFKDLSA